MYKDLQLPSVALNCVYKMCYNADVLAYPNMIALVIYNNAIISTYTYLNMEGLQQN